MRKKPPLDLNFAHLYYIGNIGNLFEVVKEPCTNFLCVTEIFKGHTPVVIKLKYVRNARYPDICEHFVGCVMNAFLLSHGFL